LPPSEPPRAHTAHTDARARNSKPQQHQQPVGRERRQQRGAATGTDGGRDGGSARMRCEQPSKRAPTSNTRLQVLNVSQFPPQPQQLLLLRVCGAATGDSGRDRSRSRSRRSSSRRRLRSCTCRGPAATAAGSSSGRRGRSRSRGRLRRCTCRGAVGSPPRRGGSARRDGRRYTCRVCNGRPRCCGANDRRHDVQLRGRRHNSG
jgi:hypothetical protein